MKRKTIFNNDDDKNTCTVIRSCKKNATDPVATNVEWVIDLDLFDSDMLNKLAVRSIVIDAQRLWREGKIADEQVITPETFITERKASTSAATSATAKNYINSEIANGRNIRDVIQDLAGISINDMLKD